MSATAEKIRTERLNVRVTSDQARLIRRAATATKACDSPAVEKRIIFFRLERPCTHPNQNPESWCSFRMDDKPLGTGLALWRSPRLPSFRFHGAWCVQRSVRAQQNQLSFDLRPLRKLRGSSIGPTQATLSGIVAIQPRSQSSGLHKVFNQFEPTVVGIAGSGDWRLLRGFDVLVHLADEACFSHLPPFSRFDTSLGVLAISRGDSCSCHVSRCFLLLRRISGSIPATRSTKSEDNGLWQRLD